MREDATPTLRVHPIELGETIPQLSRGVDDDEDIAEIQTVAIPEEHPGTYARVAQRIVRDEFDDLIEFFGLLRVAGVKTPEPVQPGELEDLLREEEGADEVGLGGEEGEIAVVDVLHVWGGEAGGHGQHAIGKRYA